MPEVCTYVLACADNCFYIGRTSSTTRRWREHWTPGKGAKWLGLHPPLRIEAVWKGDIERSLTLHYMQRFGWQNVRGGPWCARSLKKPKEIWLQEMSATPQPSQIDIEQWTIQPCQKNSHGAIFWPVTASKESKGHPKIQVGTDETQCRIPFGPSQYGEGSSSGRYSLDLSIPPWMEDYVDLFRRIDEKVKNYVFEHKELFFKKPPSREQLEEWYVPLISQKDSFDPLLRTKVNSSPAVFLVGDNGAQKGKLQDIQPGCQAVCVVSVQKIWTMSNRFGVTAVTEALMCFPRQEKAMNDIFATAIAARSQPTCPDPAALIKHAAEVSS